MTPTPSMPHCFTSLPTHLINGILLLSLDLNPSSDLEVRACHCLPASTDSIPFRATLTTVAHEPRNGYDVHISSYSCLLDTNSGLGPWCCRQYLNHPPGRRRHAPALALTSWRLFNIWRDLTTWVFCSERCLEVAIRRLSLPSMRIFSHVRFLEVAFELTFWENRISKEYYSRADRLEGQVYVSAGSQQMIYQGQQCWVKDLWLEGSRYGKKIVAKNKDIGNQSRRPGKGPGGHDGPEDVMDWWRDTTGQGDGTRSQKRPSQDDIDVQQRPKKPKVLSQDEKDWNAMWRWTFTGLEKTLKENMDRKQ